MTRTVLLIDGDSDSLTIFSIILEHRGFRVLRASESERGLQVAREEQPDLVILEPFAAPVRGDTLVEAFRRDGRTAHLPVLLVTAAPGLVDALEPTLTPRDRVLLKPCHPLRIVDMVEQMLGLELTPGLQAVP